MHDWALQQELSRLRGTSCPVQVLVMLAAQKSPFDAQAVVATMVQDAEQQCKESPRRVVVFKHLHVFAVEASVHFIECLLQHPSVDSATLNA